MAMISKDGAERIAKAFVAETYNPLDLKHIDRADPLITAALENHFGVKLYAQSLQLGDKFNHEQKSVTIRLMYNGQIHKLTGRMFHNMPRHIHSGHGSTYLQIKDAELARNIEAWSAEQTRLETERKEMVIATKLAILAFRTDTVLRQKWPEVAKFLPKKDEPAAPVAVRTDTIMEKLAAARTPKETVK